MKLPNGQFGSIAEYGSGFASLTRTGRELQLNTSPERLPVVGNGPDVRQHVTPALADRHERKRGERR